MRSFVPAASATAAQRTFRLRRVRTLFLQNLLKLRVHLLVHQFQPDQLRVVVDRHRRAVSLRLEHVVGVNHLAEHRLGVRRREAHRRPGEADERRIRQCAAKLIREAFLQPVLRPVRLVSDDDQVPPLRKNGMHSFIFIGSEFLDCRENHLAALTAQQRAQFRHRLRVLHFAHERLHRHELIVQLVVQIRAIHLDHERRILHLRMTPEDRHEVSHRERFPRALRVPDHADLPVAVRLTDEGTILPRLRSEPYDHQKTDAEFPDDPSRRSREPSICLMRLPQKLLTVCMALTYSGCYMRLRQGLRKCASPIRAACGNKERELGHSQDRPPLTCGVYNLPRELTTDRLKRFEIYGKSMCSFFPRP
jgi:hypothetical protein